MEICSAPSVYTQAPSLDAIVLEKLLVVLEFLLDLDMVNAH